MLNLACLGFTMILQTPVNCRIAAGETEERTRIECSGDCILGGAVGLVPTPTQSKMARSLMRGIQLKVVFVVATSVPTT